MRRTPVAAAAFLAVALTGGAAYADPVDTVTDTVTATALPGLVTMVGAGVTAAVSPTIGSASTFSSSIFTVTDATGANNGWYVNAKYEPLGKDALTALSTATPAIPAENLGGNNLAVKATPVAGNADTGVPDDDADWSPSTRLTDPAGVRLVNTKQDGRGVTKFTASYTVILPAKSTNKATLYAGTVVYTVTAKS
jgi:hypothetical protein